MFTSNDKREINRGFGDGMSRAFELAATPLIFGALGFVIDRALGTGPIFAVGLALFAVAGTFVRVWFGYDQEMKSHEARFADRRTTPDDDHGPVDLWATPATDAEDAR